jgi:hypothetical protein
MKKRWWTVAIAMAALSAACAGTASANTITVGNPLTGPGFNGGTFFSSPTLLNTQTISGATAASPVDGTVTAWAVRGDGTFSAQVIHPNSGGTFTNVVSSKTADLSNDLGTGPPQPTSLPIKAGDFLGLTLVPTDNIWDDADLGLSDRFTNGLAVGQTLPPNNVGMTESFAYNVTVRYCVVPDLAGHKLASSTALLKSADCALGSVRKPKSKRKRRKATFVRTQSASPGASISDTAPIDLRLGKKPKKHKRH